MAFFEFLVDYKSNEGYACICQNACIFQQKKEISIFDEKSEKKFLKWFFQPSIF